MKRGVGVWKERRETGMRSTKTISMWMKEKIK